MLPSSSRVKLNRVALKDVVGLKLVPRRRRPPKSPHDVSADPKNQEETSVSEQLKAHKHPSSSSQPAGSPPRSQNGSHPPGTRREEEPEEKRKGGTHGPTTGGKYQQGTANTKGRRRVDSVRKVSGLAPRVRRCLCADSDSREVQDRVKPRGKVSKRKRKGRTTAKSLREGGRVKAKVAGCASNTGPVRKETPRRLSNIDRNTHQTSSGLADSEMLMRRAAGVSRCDLCGECKYISLQRKALGKQGPKSAGLGPEPPSPGLKIKEENAVTQTPQKTVIWKNQYPQVTLCDIANKCDACDHGCGYVLPDALKTKVVHCFRKDIRAPFRFWPTCFGRNKPSSEKTALVNGIEHCQSVQLEKSIWDRDAEEDLGTGSDPVDAESRRDKRIKLGESAGCISAFDSAPKDNCTTSRGQRGDPTKTDGAQISSDLFCHINDEEKDEPESFTCQRVRAYFRKVNFSCARAYMAWPFLKNCGASSASTESSVGPVEPSAKGRTDSETVNYNVQGSSSNQVSDILPNVPTDKQEEGREQILAWGDETRHREDMETAPLFIQTEESESRLHLYSASFSTPAQSGRECSTDAVSSSSLLFNGTEIASSVSTSSPSALGLNDWNTATSLSPMSSPFTQGSLSSLSATPSFLPPSLLLSKRLKGVEITAVENTLVAFEETQPTSCSPPVPQYNSDSFQWCESFSTIPQVEHTSPEELVAWRSPPKLELYCNTSPFKGNSSVGCSKQSSLLRSVSQEHCVDLDLDEFMLPPVLSPVSSPQQQMCRRTSSDEENEEEEMNKDPSCFPQISNCSNEKSEDCLGCHIEELDGILSRVTTPGSTPREPRFSPSSDKDVDHSNVGESQEETDSEDDVEQGSGSHEQVSLHRNIKASLNSGVLTEPCSSPSSDEEDGAALSDEGESCSDREEGSGLSKIEGRERDKSEAAGDSQPGILDEFAAYEQDILLVDVIQDDPELFDSLPEQSLLTMGPATVTKAPKSKPTAVANMPRVDVASRVLGQRLTQVTVDVPLNSPAIKEESNSRPWRPQCSTTPIRMQNNTCPATSDKQTKQVAQFDVNNNHVNGGPERNQPIKTVSSPHYIHPLMSIGPGLWIKNSANVTDFRRQKSNSYCRLYFSESLSCGFKMCRFQHLPVEGDEKFCVETVTRFTKNPMCLQKAGAVFTGYYQNNPPGVYFSMPMLFSLLWALLRAGMVSDVFSVLGVSLAHNIVPSHEFLLALFNYVREKGLMGFVPELIQLTFKMANAGLELSLDCLDCVRNAPVFQHMVHSNSPSLSGNHKLSIGAPFPEYLNLAHSIVEMELCMKQEDWKRMGEVFRSICLSSQHPNQVERISGRVAITLLSESKDKLSLPFTAFAETVCQNEGEDSIVRSFVGRIGVSLMLRYHKTHQWAKGRRVVETLCSSKVNYSTLKGLFGNEDGMSRCCLVTVAAELLLLSGSVEGALNTLRENKWFLSSCLWPCEPADLESRTRVLMRLAEKTSHRDTLEVLCNLPGVKEPSDLIDISRYSPLFNSHLRVCVDRQILPVASDTVDFMLAKNLAVDHTVLQVLLHKLGKQNLWLRAREVFRHSLSVGCYPGVSAPPGFMVLIVPCRLGEVELALSFEMFITVNASVIHHLPETTSSSLSITLTRTQSCESEYLSAGSRLLSAACIPQPKLTVHYTAVNAAQEQVFTLDVSSARRWLRHNHLWAHEMWPH